jgi:hypothetical protein
MPSASLLHWRNDRMPRLHQVDIQCTASAMAVPPSPSLIDENQRAYVLLLSAHFQGFCRDLYSECAQIVSSKVRSALQFLIDAQFNAERKLDHGNPNLHNIRADFERFGFTLNLAAADPVNPLRVAHLGELNRWRNVAAHHGRIPMGLPPLNLPAIQDWRSSCDGLATSLDDIMYNQMRRILRRAPW